MRRMLTVLALVLATFVANAENWTVVTTCEDGEKLGGGKVTLRDAIRELSANTGGVRTVTFNCSGSNITLASKLILASGSEPVAIDGRNGGRGMTLTATPGNSLIESSGAGLTLRNLTFTGACGAVSTSSLTPLTAVNCAFTENTSTNSNVGAAIQAGGSSNSLERCSFTQNNGGAVRWGGGPIVNCFFAANSAGTGGAASAVVFSSSAPSVVAYSSFVYNIDGQGAVVANAGCALYVAASVFAQCTDASKALSDIRSSTALTLCGARLSAPPTGSGTVQNIRSRCDVKSQEVCSPGFCITNVTVEAVLHWVAAPCYSAAMTGDPLYLWHDASWANVAWSSDAAGATRQALVGDAAAATVRVVEDLSGAAEECSGRGAFRRHWLLDYTLSYAHGIVEDGDLPYFACGTAPGAMEVATIQGCAFQGWWGPAVSAHETKDERWWDASGNPDALKVVPYQTNVVLTARWNVSSSSFTVTEAHDDPHARGVTLRTAVQNAAGFPDVFTNLASGTITFSGVSQVGLAATLTLGKLTLLGPTSGTGVSLVLESGADCPLLACDGDVTLRNLTVRGGRGAGAALTSAQNLFAENCAFTANSAASDSAAVVVSGASRFVNCTFADNTNGALRVKGGTCVVANATFAGNTGTALNRSGGTAWALHATFASGQTHNLAAANVKASLSDNFAFGGARLTQARSGVTHTYVRPCVNAAVTNAPVYVWHDADWRNVATGSDASGADRVALVGSKDAATVLQDRDLLGETPKFFARGAVQRRFGVLLTFDTQGAGTVVGDEKVWVDCGDAPALGIVAKGSGSFVGWWSLPQRKGVKYMDENGNMLLGAPYADGLHLYVGWETQEYLLRVTSLEPGHGLPHAGIVTLQDALDAAAANPALVDAEGERRITFHCADTLLSVTTPFQVVSGTKPVLIDGLNDGRGMLIRGAAGVRLFTHAGEGLALCNLTLDNGRTNGLGGAVLVSSGAFAATNCHFRSFAAEKGGVAYVQGGSAHFEACTIEGNRAETCGAAFAGAAGTRLTAANCTLLNNGESSSSVAVAEGDGALELVNCTFADNAAPPVRTAVAASRLYGCVLVDGTVTVADPAQLDHCTLSVACSSSVPGAGTATCLAQRQDLFSDGTTAGAHRVGQVATVEQTWYEPVAHAGTFESAAQTWHRPTDQLGKASQFTGRGSVRSALWTAYRFDGNGGSSPSSISRACGAKAESVPVATRRNWTFNGWTDPSGVRVFDAGGNPLNGYVTPFVRELVLTADWQPTAALIVVNSERDALDINDDEITLRDALKLLEDNPQLAPRTVSFAPGVVTVTLTNALTVAAETVPFAIDGWSGTDGVTLRIAATGRPVLETAANVTLANLAVTGASGASALALSGASVLSAGNCAFTDNAASEGGVLALQGKGCAAFVGCAFRNNRATAGAGGAVCVGSGASGQVTFAHCTFTGNASASGGAAADLRNAADALVANCTFVGNAAQTSDGAALSVAGATVVGCAFAENAAGSGLRGMSVAAGKAKLLRTTFADGYAGSVSATEVVTGRTAQELFVRGAQSDERTRYGVGHAVFVPSLAVAEAGMAQGVFLWHDAPWSNVAWTASAYVRTSSVLRGEASKATVAQAVDELGTVLNEPPRGAVTQEESGLVVTTADDVVDPGDGKISLREALNTANRRLGQAEADGYYPITFSDALFADGAERVVVSLTNDLTVAVQEKVRIRGRADVTVRAKTSKTSLTVESGAALALEGLTVDFAASAWSRGDESNGPTAGIFVDSLGTVAFRRCSFTGSGEHNGCLLRSRGSATDCGATVESCSFTGAKCGTLALLGSRHYRVTNCTFANVVALANDGVLWVGGLNDSIVANCTAFGCHTPRAAVYLQPTMFARQHVINCIAAFNWRRIELDGTDARQDFSVIASDYLSGSKSCFYHTAYVGIEGYNHVVATNCTVVSAAAESKVFARELTVLTVDGSPRYYRPLSLTGDLYMKGCYVLHDADWQNVACSTSLKYVNNCTTVLGASAQARELLDRDVAERLVGVLPKTRTEQDLMEDVRASPGSFATPRDAEQGVPGTIEVNALEDDATSDHRLQDGQVTLREAVDYAQTHPGWRDAAGDCVITFASAAFGTSRSRSIVSAMRQIELTTFTNGTLVVRGPHDALRSLTLDGKGAKGRYRLFYVASGNALRLENLTLENAAAQSVGKVSSFNGGAVYNAGMLTVSNCAFRTCLASGSSTSYGGAVYSAPSATTCVERCSFEDCRAMYGGALANAAQGVVTAVATTFADCATTNMGILGGHAGGAFYAARDTVRNAFVNCTFARNTAAGAGGAVACDANSPRALFLVNCLLTGNRSETGGADLDAAAGAFVVTCAVGARNAVRWDYDWDITLGAAASNLFARLQEGGVPQTESVTEPGPRHVFFPLREGLSLPTRCVRWLDAWNALGHSAARGEEVVHLYGSFVPIELWLVGNTLDTDQLGAAEPDPPAPGAVRRYEKIAPVTPVPVAEDPLCVTNGEAKAFAAAVAYAAGHRELAVNGYVTVTFANNPTIVLPATVEVAAFADFGLRLVGPVTFDGAGAVRLFRLAADNALRLENVTLANGFADGSNDEYGGAVYAVDATLSASNCVFASCTAGTASSVGALGGAVEYWNGLSEASADFTDCRFTDCTARGTDAFAKALYHGSSPLALRDCTFDGADVPSEEQVAESVRARIDRPDGGVTNRLYFATLLEARAECRRGDTLVRLVADASVAELKLPDGVSYADESGASDALSVQLLASAVLQLEDYAARTVTTSGRRLYCVRATATRAVLARETANLEPLLTEEGAEVDLTGDTVVAIPANLAPYCRYGLGRSATPAGPYAVGRWLRTDAEGYLPEPLTAPKEGETGFYRVLMQE